MKIVDPIWQSKTQALHRYCCSSVCSHLECGQYQGLFMNFLFKEQLPWHSATKRQHSPMCKLTVTTWTQIEMVDTVSLKTYKKSHCYNATLTKSRKLFTLHICSPKYFFQRGKRISLVVPHSNRKIKPISDSCLPPLS